MFINHIKNKFGIIAAVLAALIILSATFVVAYATQKPAAHFSTPKTTAGRRMVMFSGTVKQINGLDLVVEGTKSGSLKGTRPIVETMTVHLSQNSPSFMGAAMRASIVYAAGKGQSAKTRTFNPDYAALNEQTIKVGDRVRVRGILQSDGSIARPRISIMRTAQKE